MRDVLTNFCTLKDFTTSAAVTDTIDLLASCSIEAGPLMFRIALLCSTDQSTLKVEIQEGDAEGSLATVQTVNLTDVKANKPVAIPFVLEHKRYMALKITAAQAGKISAGLELGA